MTKTSITISLESNTVDKLRKFFPGRISDILELKALDAINEMENPVKKTIVERPFELSEDSMYVNYAPGKFMDKKAFYGLVQTVPKDVPITSKLVLEILAGTLKAHQAIPSQKETWPGKQRFDDEKWPKAYQGLERPWLIPKEEKII